MAAPHTSSVLVDAAAAIVTAMRARSGFRSCWTDGTGTPVFHSAEVGLLSEAARAVPALLVVMDTGDPEAPAESADATHSPGGLAATREKVETGIIRCRAVAQTGDAGEGIVQRTCDAAMDVVDAVDAELRSGIGPRLGLLNKELVATMAGVTAVKPYLAGGTVVEVEFDIRVRARL